MHPIGYIIPPPHPPPYSYKVSKCHICKKMTLKPVPAYSLKNYLTK